MLPYGSPILALQAGLTVYLAGLLYHSEPTRQFLETWWNGVKHIPIIYGLKAHLQLPAILCLESILLLLIAFLVTSRLKI